MLFAEVAIVREGREFVAHEAVALAAVGHGVVAHVAMEYERHEHQGTVGRCNQNLGSERQSPAIGLDAVHHQSLESYLPQSQRQRLQH